METRRICLYICLLIGVLTSCTDALSCYECNVFVRTSRRQCEDPKGPLLKNNCVACMKVYTRSVMHNQWQQNVYNSFEARICMKSNEYAKSEGCYPVQTDGGYIIQCFCYTDFCNDATRQLVSWTSALVIISAFLLKKILE
ncbi:hypothetical protein ACJMK2_020574 [Sinanodonta woodiana]|uniref:Protein quiver n=1 Tax=Sinanodonta woodiana TaxID=1069815 RepID=A0ABD3U0M2_SINWO